MWIPKAEWAEAFPGPSHSITRPTTGSHRQGVGPCWAGVSLLLCGSHMCMCTCVSVHMYVYIRACVCVCVHVCICMCTCMCIWACVHICMCAPRPSLRGLPAQAKPEVASVLMHPPSRAESTGLTLLGWLEGLLLLVGEEEDIWQSSRSRDGEGRSARPRGSQPLSYPLRLPLTVPQVFPRVPQLPICQSIGPDPGSCAARCLQHPQPTSGPFQASWSLPQRLGPKIPPKPSSPQSEPITSWATWNARMLPEGMVTVFFLLRWPWPLP